MWTLLRKYHALSLRPVSIDLTVEWSRAGGWLALVGWVSGSAGRRDIKNKGVTQHTACLPLVRNRF